MNTKEIKQFLKKTFGLKMLSVTSGMSKNPFLSARIKPSSYSPTLEYSEVFPLAFRQMALRVIYGENCNFAENGNAGNVRPHDIAMHAHEWNKLILGWKFMQAASEASEMVQLILDTPTTSDKVSA